MNNLIHHTFGNARVIPIPRPHDPRLKKGAPGVKTCPDCGEQYWNDYSGIAYCLDCRLNHDRICQDCGTHFDGDTEGHRLCKCCRNQETIF